MFDESKADRAVRFIENLKHTKGKFAGKPFILEPWQKKIIRDVYGTVKEDGTRQYKYVYLEVPKKNGKSEMVAATALYHTFADREPSGEVYGCASEKKQASIVFNVAVKMIDQCPPLAKRAKITRSQKIITDKITGSTYQVVSSDAYSKHGYNSSAIIFDELHAQPNRDLWDVMTFGAGDAREQPIWWIITTAGDDPDRTSVCWEQHEYAQGVIKGTIVDPTWYAVIYGYDGDDIYNEENWYKANPSLGVTISLQSVREAATAAKAKPADERLFRWLRLNQWITTKLTAWLELDLFTATEGAWSLDELIGCDCFIGLDLSSTTDLTAACYIFPPQREFTDWRVFWKAWIPEANMQERIKRDKVPYDEWVAGGFVTPTEGNVIDYTRIRTEIVESAKVYNVQELVSDPAMATMLLRELEDEGITCTPLAQTYTNLTDPMNVIEEKLGNATMTHEVNPLAAWCFGNTSVSQNGQGYKKYVKQTKGAGVIRTKRIDPTAAWVIAMARAKTYEVSAYETHGVRTL